MGKQLEARHNSTHHAEQQLASGYHRYYDTALLYADNAAAVAAAARCASGLRCCRMTHNMQGSCVHGS
jgi:hypothetical protein